MFATFNVAGDGEFPQPSFEIGIGFNGVPGTVILELGKTEYPDEGPRTVPLMRAVLQASHARAIASALLSAATEAKQR